MIPYQKEKIDNSICYFAKEYKAKTKKDISQTMLWKLLAFLDLESVKDTGIPSLGLEYKAMEKGPVPYKIYAEKPETDLYKFINIKDNKWVVICKGKPNLDYFSEYEIKAMERLILIFANTFVKTKDVSQASHDELLAWRKAFSRQPNSKINFEEMFEGTISGKDPEKLSPQEERFILQKIFSGQK